MTIKGDDSDGISKRFLDWLAGVSAIATILTTIFGLFGDDRTAKLWAFGAAIILALISSGVYFYQRRREAKLKIDESIEPLSATAALRGLLPFEEGDDLPGRGRDVQDIFTLVSSSTFRFGVLWGESGCGKTSLLRAGLVPQLRKENYLPLYIPKPTKDPQEAIRLALAKELGNLAKKSDKDLKSQLKAAAPKGSKVIILFDQFEEFFLINRTPSSRAGFIKWLGSIVNDEKLPVAFLIGIRGDFFVQLQTFAPQIPEPTSTLSTYQLQNFDTEQAKQIFSAAAKADGIQFEPELIQAVIKELEAEDFIRPAELQVVGTRLKRKNITRESQYEALGGARGILSSYINEEIKQSQNEHTARLVLRLMCADVVETKSQTDLSLEDILHRVSGTKQAGDAKSSSHPEEIQAILNQFVNARVLIHTDDDKYNLVHDYLAPYVRTATEGTETSTERANRMLKRYVAEYKEDPRTRIPFSRVRSIQKYASPEVMAKDQAQELIKKSQRTFYKLISVPLVLIASLYLFLFSSYYFSIENSYVVIRSGNSQLKFVPGFDRVVIETDFKESELDSKHREAILREQVTGLWWRKTDGDAPMWGEQLTARLEPVTQAKLLRLQGQSEQSMEALLQIINDSDDSAVRSKVVSILGILAVTEPESFTPDVIQSLTLLLQDEDYTVSFIAAFSLGELAQTKPEVVQLLTTLLTDEDTNVRSNAVSALRQLAHTKPEVFTPEIFQSLVARLTDRELSVRSSAVSALGSLAQTKPEVFTPELVQSLTALLSDEASYVRSSAVFALGSLAQTQPEVFSPELVQSLTALLSDEASYVRSNVGYALGQLAQTKPELFTLEVVQSLIAVLTGEDTNVRSNAGYALGQLAQTKPEVFTPELVQSLTALLTDEDTNVRFGAAFALGQLAQTNPELLQSLTAMLTDGDTSVRSNAVFVLSRLAQTKLEVFTPELVQSLPTLLTNEDTNVRFNAASALGPLAQAQPEVFTPELVQLLPALLTDKIPNVRSSALSALGPLAQAQPEVFTPELVQLLVTRLTDEDSVVRSNAVSVLGGLAQTKPEFFTPDLVQSLNALLTNEDAAVRSNAVSVLGGLAQSQPEIVLSFFILLKNDKDSMLRGEASNGLFLIVLKNPSEKDFVTNELEKLVKSPKLHWQIAALRTLEMIEMGDLIKEARAHPDRIPSINSKLSSLSAYSPFAQYSPYSIGEHIRFAASVMIQEIREIELENREAQSENP